MELKMREMNNWAPKFEPEKIRTESLYSLPLKKHEAKRNLEISAAMAMERWPLAAPGSHAAGRFRSPRSAKAAERRDNYIIL